MTVTLKNDLLRVDISTHGAELQSVRSVRTGHEYLWQGDPRFWGRRSPVLFPIVGAVWGGEMRIDGTAYRLGQHGFARDREFAVVDDVPDGEAWFRLDADDDTLSLYPRRFSLLIGYSLQGERIEVMWRVINNDSRPMWFQIGAHPAFNYPEFNPSDPVHGYLALDGRNLHAEMIAEAGCVGPGKTPVTTDADGMIPVAAGTFARDAIILPDRQVRRVSLMDKEHRPYLTMLFRAPVVGLWSPDPDAPFVCIEPWWGRADSVGFTGDFSQRHWTEHLAPGREFTAGYLLIIDNL